MATYLGCTIEQADDYGDIVWTAAHPVHGFISVDDTEAEARAEVAKFLDRSHDLDYYALCAHAEKARASAPAGFDVECAVDYAWANACESDVAKADRFAVAIGTFDMYLDDLGSAKECGIYTPA